MTGKRGKSASQSPSEPLDPDQLLAILGKVTKRLSDHKGAKEIMDDADMRLLFTQLRDVLSSLVNENEDCKGKLSALESEIVDSKKIVNLMSVKVTSLEGASRIHSDLSDHHHQRSLKGKFTISPLEIGNLAQREDLEQRGEKVETYVCTLIEKTFGFIVKESDICSCHFSKRGLIFRLSNLSHNSVYGDIVNAIKKGHGSKVKEFFFNFALTPQRAALLFELRKAKKGNIIEKLYSD